MVRPNEFPEVICSAGRFKGRFILSSSIEQFTQRLKNSMLSLLFIPNNLLSLFVLNLKEICHMGARLGFALEWFYIKA